jgi:hypothetical protein
MPHPRHSAGLRRDGHGLRPRTRRRSRSSAMRGPARAR